MRGAAWFSTFCLAFGALGPGEALAQSEDLRPQFGWIELGVFGGVFLPSSEHELYNPRLATHQELATVAPDFGLRASYSLFSFLAVETEGALMPTSVDSGDSAILWSVRGHLLGQYPARMSPFIVAGGGLLGVLSSDDALSNDTDGAFHWGLGLKYLATPRVLVRLDGRHFITSGRDAPVRDIAHHFEALAGVSLILDVIPSRDQDGDGVLDDRDQCEELPEDLDGYMDADGCPDEDDDGDGVLDTVDACKNEKGLVENKGCPDSDRDGDGVVDRLDFCPDEAGSADNQGCVPKTPSSVVITKERLQLLDKVYFEVGNARILVRSYPLLDDVADVLKSHPKIQRVRIEGHTDIQGSKEMNFELSQGRADAVRDYLIQKGVAAERLEARGFGEDKPIASNDTAEGRARNRRVEFVIVGSEPESESTVPIIE